MLRKMVCFELTCRGNKDVIRYFKSVGQGQKSCDPQDESTFGSDALASEQA